MKTQAIIFDLDGTLLNTLGDIAGACNAALATAGLEPRPVGAYAFWVGRGLASAVQSALEAAGAPASLAPRLTPVAREYYARHLHGHTLAYPGMNEALAALAGAGISLGVLSNKPHELTVALVRHFFPEIPFAAVMGASPELPLKPDPAGAMRLLARLGLPAAACLYVGDSEVDMALARAAGMAPIGVAWGFRGPGELAGALKILQSPQELRHLVPEPPCP